jgi:hypothetical protein
MGKASHSEASHWLLGALAVVLSACSSVPLADPAPIQTPRADLTALAVHRGLAREGFAIRDDAPGRVRAALERRAWTMTVDVTWSGTDVEVHYAASDNLDYDVRGGKKWIHRTYNDRAQRLADSISREARLILAEVDPDAFLGPPVAAPPPESEADR